MSLPVFVAVVLLLVVYTVAVIREERAARDIHQPSPMISDRELGVTK